MARAGSDTGEFMTVGGRAPIRAHLRIIAATHRDLRQLVSQGLKDFIPSPGMACRGNLVHEE